MKESILLSIVIPCFNSFQLMQKGLHVLERQLDSRTEVIAVDDCSTDGSYEKLVKYAKTSPLQMKILQNKVNSGAGATRNCGIAHAAGKYVTFLDSDDYFEDTFYRDVFPFLQKDVDCLIFDFFIDNGSKETSNHTVYGDYPEGYISTKEALAFTRGATCGKIYRTKIIQENGLHFLTLKRNEDMPFTKCSIAYSSPIYYLPKPLYHYVMQKESLMHDNSLLDPQNATKAFLYVKNRLENSYPQEVELLFAQEMLYSTGMTNLRRMHRKEWKKYIADLEQKYPMYLDNPYFSKIPNAQKLILQLMHKKYWLVLRILQGARTLFNFSEKRNREGEYH